jgi:signal transduction histidine kinase
VPEDALQAIFQPFYRINRDPETTAGNGLGLAIAAEAIRMHRGTIRAENIRPTGLEIIIQLPVGPEMPSREGELATPQPSSRYKALASIGGTNLTA